MASNLRKRLVVVTSVALVAISAVVWFAYVRPYWPHPELPDGIIARHPEQEGGDHLFAYRGERGDCWSETALEQEYVWPGTPIGSLDEYFKEIETGGEWFARVSDSGTGPNVTAAVQERQVRGIEYRSPVLVVALGGGCFSVYPTHP